MAPGNCFKPQLQDCIGEKRVIASGTSLGLYECKNPFFGGRTCESAVSYGSSYFCRLSPALEGKASGAKK